MVRPVLVYILVGKGNAQDHHFFRHKLLAFQPLGKSS